ncbi:MAG: hypothetical protein WCG97_02525 [bacterium]
MPRYQTYKYNDNDGEMRGPLATTTRVMVTPDGLLLYAQVLSTELTKHAVIPGFVVSTRKRDGWIMVSVKTHPSSPRKVSVKTAEKTTGTAKFLVVENPPRTRSCPPVRWWVSLFKELLPHQKSSNILPPLEPVIIYNYFIPTH